MFGATKIANSYIIIVITREVTLLIYLILSTI
jgi:hypothetical protein